jgi:hypothetical protein
MKRTLWLMPVLALVGACAIFDEETTPQEGAPPPPPPPPAAAVDWAQDPTAVTGWMRSLQGKPVVSYQDGLRAVAMLLDPELARQPWTTIKGRLMERDIVPKEWNYKPESNLDKGQLSYFLVKALGIDGGVMLRVLPTTRRYAFRECQHAGLIVGDYMSEAVTGETLLAALFKADLYQDEGTLNSLRRP